MHHSVLALSVLAVAACLNACSDNDPVRFAESDSSRPDGGVDAGGDAGVVTGADAGVDAAVDTGQDCSICDAAQAQLGRRACVCRVPDEALWKSLTVRVSTPGVLRSTKYMVPARADARLPTSFMDAHAFADLFHYDFMRLSFPDLFAGLRPQDYPPLILDPAQREFYAGVISEYLLGGQVVLYGFVIWDDPAEISTTITCDQAREVYRVLDAHFDLAPLAFVPFSGNQRDTLSGCDVPNYDPEIGVAYEAYTEAVGYGTLRRYRLPELALATDARSFNWQDVLVLDEAPADIETVVSGAMTGTQQASLSHLNVRSAARGTPNCYLEGAYDLLEPWEGKLVRFECGSTYWSVDEATVQEAQTYWSSIRPSPVVIPEADREWSEGAGLLDVPTNTQAERATAAQRYGAKGSNLAILYQRLEARYQMAGFLVPFRYYFDFVQAAQWRVDLGNGPAPHSFADTLDAWLADPTFRTDGQVRRQRLSELVSAMQATHVNLDLSAALRDTFGSDPVMLRFRSSSNAEDAVEFNGAGLYDSASGCLADDLDGDDKGPSRCDAGESKEHTVERALARVWASLWKPEAYDEREWYGVDQRLAAMAVLVDPRIQKELANIVAFSGNPTATDERYLVNAQAGELAVVAADPGVFPEVSLLTVQGGSVTAIDRVRGSSEVTAGTLVIDDDRLRELGGILWRITQVYPVDDQVPQDKTILFDTEWKIRADGQVIVKQVRPFLKD
jgi:pyruvate, water dikinase